jgi:hypothetical protein
MSSGTGRTRPTMLQSFDLAEEAVANAAEAAAAMPV